MFTAGIAKLCKYRGTREGGRNILRFAEIVSLPLGGCPSLTFTDAKGLDERVRRVFPGIGREQQALQPFHFARKRVYVKSHIRKGAVLTGRKFAGPMAGVLISILSDGAHYVQSHCPRAFRHL